MFPFSFCARRLGALMTCWLSSYFFFPQPLFICSLYLLLIFSQFSTTFLPPLCSLPLTSSVQFSHRSNFFSLLHLTSKGGKKNIWKSSLPLSSPHSLLSSRAAGWHQTQWHFVEISQRLSPWSVSDLWLPQSSLNSSQFLAGVNTASVVAKLEMEWLHYSSGSVFVLLTRCRMQYWCVKFHCHYPWWT